MDRGLSKLHVHVGVTFAVSR